MNKILSTIISVVVALSFSAALFAAVSPETVELPSGVGKIIFHHNQHQEKLRDCTKCHSTPAGGQIKGFGKDMAHKTCKGCHSEMGKGPISCKDCHRR